MESSRRCGGNLIQRQEYPWDAMSPTRSRAWACSSATAHTSRPWWTSTSGGTRGKMPGWRTPRRACTPARTPTSSTQDMIREHKLNACGGFLSPRTHEISPGNSARLGSESLPVRDDQHPDQCSWVHRDDPVAARKRQSISWHGRGPRAAPQGAGNGQAGGHADSAFWARLRA